MKLISGICAMSVLFLFTACNSADKDARSDKDSIYVADSIRHDNEEFARHVNQEKQDAKANLDKVIKDIDVQIDKMDKESKVANTKRKAEIAEQKTKLEKSRADLQKDFNDLDKTMDNNWKDFKHAVDESVDSVQTWLK